ncbi:uncharacterized protein MELLADRAFT_63128 [Melampsora larici-populina 98AG31]|uniref:BHLH domain-containing protein n=1 Tax=Melampsora larici-populina (strain 98AG31 / pathotype 3-4-7) TaxID=747676 RepID=F4RLI6_MELLP|nr:uncharacterized protein MELLADRAFT_63128 [Melampsora larici-populina 98AG31]EGG06746.1 hypothetical protein MELLADRAFT_63128 [Melampsora larici-populina 98AG31]
MFAQDPTHHSHSHSQHSQSQPPRRLEGFHVSPTPIPIHQSQSESQSQPMLHQHQQQHHHNSSSSPFNHLNGFGSDFGSHTSARLSDNELLESLIVQTSSSFNFEDPLNTSFSATPSNHDQLSNQNTFQPQPPQQQHTPLRSLPRHLDQSTCSPSISNSALSPNDIYSPTSGYNSSGPTHHNDMFAEHHYGSFSSAPTEDLPRSGRTSSMSGKAPAPRSRSARRPSGSFPSNHPNNGGSRPSMMKDEISSLIGSPVFNGKSGSVEGHQDLNNLESNNVVLNEKRRKRRESHNAVERRRRENINDRISDLFTLLPSCMIEGGNGNGTLEEGSSNGNQDQYGNSNLTSSNNLNNPKHNKGFILTKLSF